MATEGWTNAAIDEYYDPVIGTQIVRVHHDSDAVWFHLSDGAMLEIVAEQVGFVVNIHPHAPNYTEIPTDAVHPAFRR